MESLYIKYQTPLKQCLSTSFLISCKMVQSVHRGWKSQINYKIGLFLKKGCKSWKTKFWRSKARKAGFFVSQILFLKKLLSSELICCNKTVVHVLMYIVIIFECIITPISISISAGILT